MKILWIIFWGHNKTGLFFGVIFMHLGSFLKVNVQNGDIFGVAKNGVCLILQIFFILFGVCVCGGGGGGGGKQ